MSETAVIRNFRVGSGEISYRLRRSNRKTMAISVLPDLRIEVVAPNETSVEEIEERLRKRAVWIGEQQGWFRRFLPRTPEPSYLSGETLRFLGRRYRLKVREGKSVDVSLSRNNLTVTLSGEQSSERVARAVRNWCRREAKHRFGEVIAAAAERYGLEKLPRMQVRTMTTRWGSLSPGGVLTLNIRLIEAPPDCIEYVIVHELTHLEHPGHGAPFRELLTRRLPDWERRKELLETAMA